MEQEQIMNLLDLLPNEIRELIQKLNYALDVVENEKRTTSRVVCNAITEKHCPACSSCNFVKNGKSNNKIQTYKCKECGKRFNDLTNTLFANSKLTMPQIEKLFQCMNDKSTICEMAEIMQVNIKTAFSYRHKILDILSGFNEQIKLCGNTEIDEHYMSINLKGTKPQNMPRASKPRQSHGGSKRGISNHQVCIASAIDEFDNIYFKIVGTGPITKIGVTNAFKERLKSSVTMITDCKSSYEEFASDNKMHLEQIKSGTYKNLNGYSLGNINGIHSDLENFLSKFRGVSTKHLKGYLCWFSFSKILKYTTELFNRVNKFMNDTMVKMTSININNLYNNTSGIDFNAVYEEYHYQV